MSKRSISHALLLLVAAALLPLRTDGGDPECKNAITSVASSVNDPVNGDESFFKLPTGPANVMLLLDQSGSMEELPQCGDYSWNNSSAPATCKSPSLTAPSSPNGKSAMVSVVGTCAPSTLSSSLAWMEAVTPQTTYADPGRTNTLLRDCPTWGNGGADCGTRVCSGDSCLFDPEAYYFYGDWYVDATSAGATRRAHDTSASLPRGCFALSSSGTLYRDADNNPVDLGAACRTCMANRGFYFYRVRWVSSVDGGHNATGWTSSTGFQLKGTFLNANPPKFATARKVVKDLAWMDPAVPSKLDQVRLGLSTLDSGGSSPRKARLIVPFGPDKSNSFPTSQDKFRQARQYILSVLNGDATGYTTDGAALKADKSNLLIDASTISGGFFDPANGSTPLASALLNVGQYFTTTNFYNGNLGSSSYQTTEFAESSSGRVKAPWATTNACSVCWACQNNSVIVITDGSPNSEISFPTLINNYDNNTYVLSQNCGSSGNNCISPSDTSNKSRMPRIASWLHNTDLRDNGTTGGKQALTIHTIGINIGTASATNKAATILQAAANMGGGMYQNADDPRSLADAVFNAVNQVIPKENSFSAASANSLQTVQTAASEAYLTRFKPNQSITWQGHVLQATLFDEYLAGCDPTKSASDQPMVTCGPRTIAANFNGDEDSNGLSICSGVFMVDEDCDEITEDATTGDFIKKGVGTPAKFPWDAGVRLSNESLPTTGTTGYRSADESATNARNIFTWVNGVKVEFKSNNAATLRPFMNIDPAWCTAFLARIGVSGGTDPLLECTKEVIYFVRGWDVLNQDNDGCAGPGKSNPTTCQRGAKGEERDRPQDNNADDRKVFWKLGDVFHSSPAVLESPSDEIRCDTGYQKQCVSTLYSPKGIANQTAIESYTVGSKSVDAYEAYRQDNILRPRVVLVGANDGMLHAFHAGDPVTSAGKDAFGGYPYDAGTGEELWAFIPPDLLPRLRGMLDAHQYMVDGSVMLREVWVDGGPTGDPARADRKKQRDEYHAIAIVGRRAGGNQYSALDVTDPVNPRFLWNFPEGSSNDATYMGQSWSDFAPQPPPIGPVKIKSSAARGFDEKWIAMINGGYDPTLTKGRVVFMVDSWTGKTVWRFTDDDFKTQMNLSAVDRPKVSMFPVPAGISLVDLGDPSKPVRDVDGFFDTATWGDMGGNVWVARFQLPGDASTGLVNNWFAARTFEEQRRSDNAQYISGRSEFFFKTANTYEPTTRTMRTYLGSGNRERMMTQTATCGADNLLACCQAGCTKVVATTTDNYGACTITNTFSCENGQLLHDTATTSGSCTPATCAASPGNSFTSIVNLHWECPGAGVISDSTGTVSCDANGVCAVSPVGSKEITGTFNPPPQSRFYGFWSYGGHKDKTFDSKLTAQKFDTNRFTDVPFTGCAGPTGGNCQLIDTTHAKVTFSQASPYAVNSACDTGTPGCSAQATDAGWFYTYGQVCPLKSCSPPPPWLDEKTGSNANIVFGCTNWGGFRPFGMTGSTDPCTGGLGTPISYGYFADYISGVPTSSCFGDSSSDTTTTTLHRAGRNSITAPPAGGTVRVTITDRGINYSSLRINAGSAPTNTSMGTRTQVSEPVYWLEVPRQLHSCRHETGGGTCR